MAKKICFLIASDREDQIDIILNNYDNLIEDFYKNFGTLYILDFSKFLLIRKFKKKKVSENEKFKYILFTSYKEIKEFFNKNNIIAINSIGTNLIEANIWLILNFFNFKLINIQNDQLRILSEQKNNKGNIINFKFYYIYRILSTLGLMPKVDYLFLTSKELYNSIYNGISCKLDNFFKIKFFSLYKTIKLINIKFIDYCLNYKSKEDVITFIDTAPFDHPALNVFSNERVDNSKRKIYYDNLYIFLKNIKKFFNKEVIVCLHPKYNKEYIYQDYKDIKCEMHKTYNLINCSELVIFSSTSVITMAILANKKIFQIDTDQIPKYFQSEIKSWQKIFPFTKINIDNVNLNNLNMENKITESKIKIQHYDKIKEKIVYDSSLTSANQILKEIKNL